MTIWKRAARRSTLTTILALAIGSATAWGQPERDTAAALDAAADALEAAADAATKQDEVSTKDAGDQLWRPTVIYDPLVDAFLDDAKRFGRAGKAARRSVAARYGLTVPMLDETISFLRAMERDGYNGGRKIALRSQALRLVSGTDRPPILVALAAAAIDQLAEDGCGADEVAELMRGDVVAVVHRGQHVVVGDLRGDQLHPRGLEHPERLAEPRGEVEPDGVHRMARPEVVGGEARVPDHPQL